MLALALALALAVLGAAAEGAAGPPPNLVLFFVDDMAYGDLGVTGAPTTLTPNIDRLAVGGRRLSGWYSGGAICSPSRASMVTGRHYVRTGVYPGAWPCNSPNGMSLDEVTLGEAVGGAGYKTAFVGKWHLGQLPQFLPTNRGFDRYFGVPYSIDMGSTANATFRAPQWCPYIPLLRDLEVVEQPVNIETVTERYVDEAVEFIEEAHGEGKPFLLVLANSHVHVTIPGAGKQYSGEKFRGSSRRGAFGDAVAETDWSVGEVMRKLDELALTNNTLVMFTSDNGPWMQQRTFRGSEGPFRGMWGVLNGGYDDTGKGSTWEGGYRVPAFASWPGVIPPMSVSQQPLSTLDIFPTFAKLAGAEVAHEVDGHDIFKVLTGGDAAQPNVWRSLPLWRQRDPIDIAALRMGKYKFHFNTQSGFGFDPVVYHDPPLVFDVEEDPGEQWPLDPEADAVKPLVHRAWREFLRLNATIVRHEPLQVGGDRKYAVCQRERLEDCFPPVPASAEECRAGDHECHTADWGFTSNLHERGAGAYGPGDAGVFSTTAARRPEATAGAR